MDDIKITCVNPLCDDETDHLWINLEKSVYHCWKCGYAGKIVNNKEIMKILRQQKYRAPAKKTSTTDSLSLIKPEEFVTIGSLKKDHQARKYIDSRGITVETCEENGVMYSPQGKLYGRLVFPIRSMNQIVGWQGRSIYDKNPKYIVFGKKSSGFYSMRAMPDYQKFVIIFEGVFDVLKVPDFGLCIFGKKISPEQSRLLSTFLNVKIIFVMLDSDANEDEMELCNVLNKHFKTIPIQLKSGDPGDLTENEILELCIRKLK
jgi:DNA primase